MYVCMYLCNAVILTYSFFFATAMIDAESDLPRPASLSALSSASLTAAEYNAEVLQQSEYYLSPEAVKEIIAAEQLVNTKDAQRVFVCYGRSSVEIGEIWLHSTDTYKDGEHIPLPCYLIHLNFYSRWEIILYLLLRDLPMYTALCSTTTYITIFSSYFVSQARS